MNLTPDQERAVAVTGIDMCVRAGAGSGKTRVLIERAVRLLTREEDPLRLSEILAITFTEKASLEMKVRLADELEKHRGPRRAGAGAMGLGGNDPRVLRAVTPGKRGGSRRGSVLRGAG